MSKLIVFVLMLAMSGISFGQQRTEEQCKQNVKNLWLGVESAYQQRGMEPRVKDLTLQQILDIQNERGSCGRRRN